MKRSLTSLLLLSNTKVSKKSSPLFLNFNRSLLTESDSAKPKSQEEANWPRYQSFTLANITKLNTNIEQNMFTRLQQHLEKTRSIFDKGFEKVTGKRMDGIGYWIVASSVIFVNLAGLNIQMKKKINNYDYKQMMSYCLNNNFKLKFNKFKTTFFILNNYLFKIIFLYNESYFCIFIFLQTF